MSIAGEVPSIRQPERVGLPINRRRLATDVAAFIRDLVVSGYFRPGQKLPLVQLAEEARVSTTPVREALLLLETEGLVRSEPRRGFYVVPLLIDDVQDLFELHAIVAGRLAERAASRLTGEQLEELDGLDVKIKAAAALGDGQLVEELNFQFHRIINYSASSSILRRFLAQTARYVPRRFYADIPGWMEASAAEHESILTPLRMRDDREARDVMEEHIRRAGTLLALHLHERGLVGQVDLRNDVKVVTAEACLSMVRPVERPVQF